MMRLLTVLGLGAVLACGRLTSDDGAAEVVGQVVDRQGAPVAGVRVMLIRDRRPVFEVTTSRDGRFTLKGPAGAAAVFGLQQRDQGVWRANLELLPAGQTDVGQLELETVWAHPEVLWLRGTGFDEQLTRAEDDLGYFGGGGPGQPLLASRVRRDQHQLFRVEDDGTPVLLASGRYADPNPPGDLSKGAAPTYFYPPAFDAEGRMVVLGQQGGYTRVTAAGVETAPVSRLTWLDVRSGATVLDVPVPASAEPAWTSVQAIAGVGALIHSSAGNSLAVLRRRAVVPLAVAELGTLLSTSRGELFTLQATTNELWLSRLGEDGAVSSGPRVERPAGLPWTWVIDDVVVYVARDSEVLTIVRFDAASLEARVERFPLGQDDESLGTALSSSQFRSCDGSPPPGIEETFEHGLRHTRIRGQFTERLSWRVETDANLYLGHAGCPTANGLWRLLRRPSRALQLLRIEGASVDVTDLPGDVVGMDRVGPWPVLIHQQDGRYWRELLPVDASLSPLPFSRVPFVLPTGGLSSDNRFVFAPALVGEGHIAVFRVPAPDGATR